MLKNIEKKYNMFKSVKSGEIGKDERPKEREM